MKILLLGGTRFLGRHLVEAARAGGHELTLFNRGRTNPGLHADLETLHGDRDGQLAALEGRDWDAVVDPGGYVPRVVRQAARLLAPSVKHYTFISSCSVYADFSQPGQDESAPTLQLADPETEDIPANYGGLKMACETALEEVLAGRVLHVRAGLIVGPWDSTGRFTYWPRRIAEGGEVLAPGPPEAPVQFIHARDLADWIVRMAEAGTAGVFNATGPVRPHTTAEMLESCRRVSGSDAKFRWVDEAWVAKHEVQAWSELPVWLPSSERGLMELNVDRAVAAGLTFRPLDQTVLETLEWQRSQPQEMKPGEKLPSGAATQAGLSREREAELLRQA